MELTTRELRLFAIFAEEEEAEGRAALILDRLASRRPVRADGSGWTVAYDDVDTEQALRLCAKDLAAIDGSWADLLDFEALPSTPIPDPEFI
jgi:hypothetical protein